MSQKAIFCFGSNTKGVSRKGAAQFAAAYRGAEQGVGRGLTGGSYALPTKDDNLKPLPLWSVLANIDEFLAVARSMPDSLFQVTRVGCGLAGFRDDEIAPAFATAPANCVLPFTWERLLGRTVISRVIVAGSRSFKDADLLTERLDYFLSRIEGPVEIVSGGARGADVMGETYAVSRRLKIHRMPAEWDLYGKQAGFIRNRKMSWFSSHLVAFWDGMSPGTDDMLRVAAEDKLAVRAVRF